MQVIIGINGSKGWPSLAAMIHQHRAVRSERRSDGLDHTARATINRAGLVKRMGKAAAVFYA